MATSKPVRLHWLDDNPDATPLHFVRHHFPADTGWPDHDHDFSEVFWCESGGGTHLVNDVSVPLATGDVVCLRAHDRHSSRSGRHGMTIVNVSFQPHTVAGLAVRHRDVVWPWREGPLPLHQHLVPARMERLHTWAADLGARAPRRIDLDCFLLDLVRILGHLPDPSRPPQPRKPRAAVPLPGWLRDALEIFIEPRHLAGGTTALARLAGRSQDHLNRVVRRCQGRTATELVTDLRLDHAAAALRTGDQPISAIAASVGLANLSHFYACFARRFGATPRSYRLAARQAAG